MTQAHWGVDRRGYQSVTGIIRRAALRHSRCETGRPVFWPSWRCAGHRRRTYTSVRGRCHRAFQVKRTHVGPGGSCDRNERVRCLHKRGRTRASETWEVSATPTGVGRGVAPVRHKRSPRRRPGTAVETTDAADGRQLFQRLTNISEPCGSTGIAGDLSGCGRSSRAKGDA